jgi:hypothetical protein
MKIIRVSISDPNPSQTTLGLFGDAKDALYGKLLREPVAEMPDIDSSGTRFHLHLVATRHLGTVTSMLRNTLKHHGVAEQVTIERLDRS